MIKYHCDKCDKQVKQEKDLLSVDVWELLNRNLSFEKNRYELCLDCTANMHRLLVDFLSKMKSKSFRIE